MSAYDLYRARLGADGGSEIEAEINSTKQFVNSNFKQNPSYQVITVDGVQHEAIVDNGKLPNTKQILFKPDTQVFTGQIAIVESNGMTSKYLTSQTIPNEIYPKVLSMKCNNVMNVGGIEVDCVITNELRGQHIFREETDGDVALTVPKDSLIGFLPYNSISNTIKHLDKFVLNGTTWEVGAIDKISLVDGNFGIIQLMLRLTTSESSTSNDGNTKENWW